MLHFRLSWNSFVCQQSHIDDEILLGTKELSSHKKTEMYLQSTLLGQEKTISNLYTATHFKIPNIHPKTGKTMEEVKKS